MVPDRSRSMAWNAVRHASISSWVSTIRMMKRRRRRRPVSPDASFFLAGGLGGAGGAVRGLRDLFDA